ncbi:MAG: recombinase family protein [Actinomycetota bacterium]|nr:recombinase family protein [Actinomycetota bacterium]
MTATLIGYAHPCSTDEQELSAQRQTLLGLGVDEDHIYLDRGLTGTNRARFGLAQALAAARAGDTLVVPKLDRLARLMPDAREIGDSLVARGVKLSVGGTTYDTARPDGQVVLQLPGHLRRVLEVDLLRMRTRGRDGDRSG